MDFLLQLDYETRLFMTGVMFLCLIVVMLIPEDNEIDDDNDDLPSGPNTPPIKNKNYVETCPVER